MKLRFGRPKMSRCSVKSWPAVKWLGSGIAPFSIEMTSSRAIPYHERKSSTRSAPFVEKIARASPASYVSPVPLMLNS